MYDEINELIARYRDGDSEAAEKLLEMFHPLMASYYRFATRGTLNRSDPIQVGFARVYGMPPASGAAERGATIIANKLRHVDREDLWMEAQYCLLRAAWSSSNVQYGFRRNYVRRLGYYMSQRFNIPLLSSTVTESDDGPQVREQTMTALWESFSYLDRERWVSGLDCAPIFSPLTEAEREILWMFYIDGLDDDDIAALLNVDTKQAKQMRLDIVRRLRASGEQTS